MPNKRHRERERYGRGTPATRVGFIADPSGLDELWEQRVSLVLVCQYVQQPSGAPLPFKVWLQVV